MSKRKPTNLAASVRQRLLNLSKEKGEDFTLTLVRYAAERFPYRLSRSPHAEHFILKGALLLATHLDRPYRPTRDSIFLSTAKRRRLVSPGQLPTLRRPTLTRSVRVPSPIRQQPENGEYSEQ